MNWLDIVIAIILVINLFVGLKVGLIKTVISLAGVNRQGKWDSSGIIVNGHLEACSCFSREVKYRLRKEQDHDSRNNR